MQSLYDILEVSSDASAQSIKKAYKRLALTYHPDRNPDPEAAEHFKVISQAYRILSDEELKAQYDAYGNLDFTDFEPTEQEKESGFFYSYDQQKFYTPHFDKTRTNNPYDFQNWTSAQLREYRWFVAAGIIGFIVLIIFLQRGLFGWAANHYYEEALKAAEEKSFGEAFVAADRALEFDYNPSRVYWLRAEMKRNHMDDYLGAIDDYNNAIKYSGKDNHSLFFGRGDCFRQIGLCSRAAQDFHTAIKLSPKNGLYYFALAKVTTTDYIRTKLLSKAKELGYKDFKTPISVECKSVINTD